MNIKDWGDQELDQFRRFLTEEIPFNRLLGVEVTAVRAGFVRMEVPYRDELIGDPFRPAIHGGVLCTLIDGCGGAAVFTLATTGDLVSTIDLRVDFLRPGGKRRLVAEATVTRMGNRVASVDVRAFHDDAPDQLVATGKAVFSVKRSRPLSDEGHGPSSS